VAPFLCRTCSSTLGHKAEASARSDASVRVLVNALANELPNFARAFCERQRYIAVGPGGTAHGHIKNGEFVVAATRKLNGSIVQPTPNARQSIETILEREGQDAPFRSNALRMLDEAPENTKVSILPTLEFVKWSIDSLKLDLDETPMDVIVPLKCAFEFLALHAGTSVYERIPPFDQVRTVIRGEEMNPDLLFVERLHAQVPPRAFHGIAFEGNSPHAKVQVRLFGKLAFRVHFKRVAIHGGKIRYTHELLTNDEYLART